jgi:hypothetical protein
MSFKTTINCHFPIEVEIDRDGKLTLHGYEEDYDLAYTAMSGGEPTLCQKILENWGDFPYAVIGFDLGLPVEVLRYLMTDLVEYAVRTGVLDWAYPDSPEAEDMVAKHSAIVERIIAAIREHIDGVVPPQEGWEAIGELYGEYRNAEQDLHEFLEASPKAWNARETFECFGEAIYRVCSGVRRSGYGSDRLAIVAQAIRQATYPRYARMGHRPDQVKKVDLVIKKWFIARFVDIMEEWQPGQPWPKIEETL